MADFQDTHSRLLAAGYDVAALSVDDAARSEALRRQYGLAFPILCDSARQVVRAWDLYNAAERGGIAMPAVFVLERGGRVRWQSRDVTTARVRADEVLQLVQGSAAAPSRRTVLPRLRDFAWSVVNAVLRGGRTPEA